MLLGGLRLRYRLDLHFAKTTRLLLLRLSSVGVNARAETTRVVDVPFRLLDGVRKTRWVGVQNLKVAI